MTSQPTSHVRWFLVFLLFVLSAVAFLDRVNLSIAGAKISEEFGISNIRLGLVFSAFLFGYALFQTPAGWLADRFGPRRMLTLGVLWWGVFSALTAAISPNIGHTVVVLVVIRFLLGAGEAIVYPASNQFVARWIPSHERGVANGIIFAGVGIGAGITPPLISFVMLRYGWRSSFLISALIGLAVGAVWFLVARDTPDEHPSLSSNELTLIQQGIPKSAASNEGNLLSWSSILSSRNVWILSLAYFCFGYVAWVFFSWFYRFHPYRDLPCFWVRCPRCTSRELCSGRWRRLSLSFTKLVLGGFRRSRRKILRLALRLHEHGKSNRRHDYRVLDSFPGGQIWVEHGILRRGCHCRARRDRLAFGQPRTYPGPFVEKFIDLTGFI